MIGSLSGVLTEIDYSSESLASIVVDVAGVGYEVVVSTRHAARLGPLGSPVDLAVYTHVREGAITLYGFANRAERRMFELLIGAHGIGPALALAIFGRPPARAAGTGRDRRRRRRPRPGAGGRAQDGATPHRRARRAPRRARHPARRRRRPDGTRLAISEVREALAALGYAPDEVRRVLEHLPREGAVEDLLRQALQELAPRR